jgi:hypothetical protein
VINISEAISLDIAQQIEEAANAYESLLPIPDTPIDAFLNLSVLYWQSTEYGFNVGHRLSLDFIHRAAERYKPVLDEAEVRSGQLPEITFWRRYFNYIDLGDPLTVAECLELLEEPDTNKVIYLFVYPQTGNPQYLPQVRQLLLEAEQQPTTRNHYISSVLRSALQRI